jgi:hypothetical protein
LSTVHVAALRIPSDHCDPRRSSRKAERRKAERRNRKARCQKRIRRVRDLRHVAARPAPACLSGGEEPRARQLWQDATAASIENWQGEAQARGHALPS